MSEAYENPAAYISEKWWFLYKTLCREESSVFSQMTGLFTLCASIGYSNQTQLPLDKNKKDIFKWITLNPESEIPVLTAITWDTMNRSIAALTNHKEIMDISSEFAEGGMQFLYDQFFEEHSQNGQLIHPEKLDIAFNLAQVIEGLRRKHSVF